MKFSNDMKYVKIDEHGVYPLVRQTEDDDIEWTLRYGSEYDILRHRLYLASIVAAYKSLINDNQKRRNYVLSNLKKAVTSNKN